MVDSVAINNSTWSAASVEDISELYHLISELTKRIEKLENRAGLSTPKKDKTTI